MRLPGTSKRAQRPHRPSNLSGCQSCPGKHRSVSAAPRRVAGATGRAARRERPPLSSTRSTLSTISLVPRHLFAATASGHRSILGVQPPSPRKPLASRGGHRPEETAPPLPSSLAARPPLPSTSLSVKGPRPRTPRRDPIVGGIRPGHAGLPDLGCAAPRRRSHPRERLAGAGPPSCRSDVALWQLQAAEACGGTVRRSRAEAR